MSAAVSRRMARSILRSLRELLGESAYDSVMRGRPQPDGDWMPVAEWQELVGEFERHFGDPATWQLLRQATRLAMAVAISKGWSAFLADVTPDLLLDRADTFWKLSYNTGALKVLSRKPRHVRLAVEGWSAPPAPVVAMVAEACAVFLAKLGERAPRAIDSFNGERAEIDVSW